MNIKDLTRGQVVLDKSGRTWVKLSVGMWDCGVDAEDKLFDGVVEWDDDITVVGIITDTALLDKQEKIAKKLIAEKKKRK